MPSSSHVAKSKIFKNFCRVFLAAGLAILLGVLVVKVQGYLAYRPYKARIEGLLKPSIPATFYISPQGNDGNSGTSDSQPWLTLARANAVRFKAGDRLLLQGGETFKGSLEFDQDDVATVLQPITVASYGQGKATIEVPAGNGITLSNTMAFRISNLDIIAKDDNPSGTGILAVNDRPGDLKLPSIRLDHLDISGFKHYGILIDGNRGKSGFRDVVVDHVSAHDNLLGGIVVNGEFNRLSKAYAHQNVRVSYSKAYDNKGITGKKQPHSGSGIVLSDVRSGRIDHSEAYNNGGRSESRAGGPVGIWAWDADQIVIEKNYSHHNRVAGPKDGGGFDLDGGVTNSIMQYNYSFGNDGAGYLLCQFPFARRFSGNVARYNVSLDDGRRNGHGSFFFFGGIEDTDVYNNSVVISPVSSGAQPMALDIEKAGVNGLSVRNNIFFSSGNIDTVVVAPGQKKLILQGNNYYSSNPDQSLAIRWNGRLYTDLDQWRRRTGQEMFGTHGLGLSVNPQFQEDPLSVPSPEALRLKSSSPLIDSGLNLRGLFRMETGARDFAGVSVPFGGGYEIGALELNEPG